MAAQTTVKVEKLRVLSLHLGGCFSPAFSAHFVDAPVIYYLSRSSWACCSCQTMPELKQKMAERFGKIPVQLTFYLDPPEAYRAGDRERRWCWMRKNDRGKKS